MVGGQGWQLLRCDQMRGVSFEERKSGRRGVMAERRKTQEEGQGLGQEEG